MSDCPKCGHWIGMFVHACPPAWEVRDADDCDDQDWTSVCAHDEDAAATFYADQLDSRMGEGPHARTVLVRKPGENAAARYSVTFEYSIDYSAREVS
ncbi:hypothetical protein [Burkholderia gladioli]|uniref:hypothetical protein n=1 Tax=Burkholderia gladioli TaxID=28095 RepID=UPI00163E3F78|nr:hypothetical protein [Burkholderia gladioli]